jgi:hypothetical protein
MKAAGGSLISTSARNRLPHTLPLSQFPPATAAGPATRRQTRFRLRPWRSVFGCPLFTRALGHVGKHIFGRGVTKYMCASCKDARHEHAAFILAMEKKIATFIAPNSKARSMISRASP